jgi:hypothetical protein
MAAMRRIPQIRMVDTQLFKLWSLEMLTSEGVVGDKE